MRLALGEKGRAGTAHIGIKHIKVSWETKIPIKEAEYRNKTQGLKFLDYESLVEKRKNKKILDKDGKKDINKRVIMRHYRKRI